MSIGNKATQILEDEQNALKGVYDQNTGEYIHREDPVPDTVTETSITRNSDGTWNKRENTREKPFHDERAVNQIESKIGDNATTLQQFCKTIDDQIIEYNNQINSKKEQIIEITEQTLTPGNCYPGVGYSNPAGMGAPNPPLYFGTRVIMNNDIETLKIYSSMAGPDENAGVMNPFEPDEEKNLVVNNSGYGYQNLKDPLVAFGNISYPGGITTDGSGSYIGTTFLPASLSLDDSQQANYSIPYGGAVWNAVIPALSSGISAADCVGASKSIVDLYQEIVGIRSERDKLRPDLNIIKDNKKDKEIQAWGLKNMKEKIKQRGNENQSAINAIKKFTADGIKSEEGLVLFLDAGNNSSYWGTGSIWYDLTEHGNHATIIPPPPDDLLPDWHMGNNNASYFNFDGEHSYVNFDAVGLVKSSSIDSIIYDHCWDNYEYFDVDGDGIVSPTDALLIMRCMIGPAFNPYTHGAGTFIANTYMSANATRTETEMWDFVDGHKNSTTGTLIDRGTYNGTYIGEKNVYDLDANGTVTPLGDGQIINHIFGIITGTSPNLTIITTNQFLNPHDGGPAQWDNANSVWVMGTYGRQTIPQYDTEIYFMNDGSWLLSANSPYRANTEPMIASVEMLAKVNMAESVGVSSVLFGWDQYAVVGFGTTAFGYTTNNTPIDVNGIDTDDIATLGINGNWRHYVFEMRSDVAYSNNKIYINGSLVNTSTVFGSQDMAHRSFNNGVGRIGGWRFNNDHLLDGSVSMVKIYNKSFTGEEIKEKYDALKGRFGI